MILSGQNSWAHYKVLFFCPFLLFCKKEFFWQREYPVYIHKEVWSMKSGSVLKMKRYAFRMGICQTWMVLKAFENVFLICGWIWAFIRSTTFLMVAFDPEGLVGENLSIHEVKWEQWNMQIVINLYWKWWSIFNFEHYLSM